MLFRFSYNSMQLKKFILFEFEITKLYDLLKFQFTVFEYVISASYFDLKKKKKSMLYVLQMNL